MDAINKIKERAKNPCCPTFKLVFMDYEMPKLGGVDVI
jgi:hypothetical protein